MVEQGYRGGDPVTNEQLLELDVDLLIPAALGDVITPENAPRIKAPTIVEAANAPAHLNTIRKVKGHPLWVSVRVNKNDVYNGSLATLKLNDQPAQFFGQSGILDAELLPKGVSKNFDGGRLHHRQRCTEC
jgi:hypothetical protein